MRSFRLTVRKLCFKLHQSSCTAERNMIVFQNSNLKNDRTRNLSAQPQTYSFCTHVIIGGLTSHDLLGRLTLLLFGLVLHSPKDSTQTTTMKQIWVDPNLKAPPNEGWSFEVKYTVAERNIFISRTLRTVKSGTIYKKSPKARIYVLCL